MVFFSSRISPFTSTVIFFDRSPVATAVVTAAMFRTWPVRLRAMKLTESVKSFHACLATKNSLGTHFARHTCYLRGEGAKLINHHVDRIFELKEFTFDIDSDFLRQIAVRYCRRYRRDIANLRRKIAGH